MSSQDRIEKLGNDIVEFCTKGDHAYAEIVGAMNIAEMYFFCECAMRMYKGDYPDTSESIYQYINTTPREHSNAPQSQTE